MKLSKQDIDAFQIYVPFLDFIVRYGLANSEIKLRVRELIAQAGCSVYERGNIEIFLSSIDSDPDL